jgi:tetratricopeptide (TPR) repeat protein
LEEGVRRGEAIHFLFSHSLAVMLLAEAYLQGGRAEEALREAARALELARTHKERGYEAYALRALGEVSAQDERLGRGQAGGHYSLALEIAETLQMRPLAARCRLGLGILHRQIDAGRAEEEFSAARELFRSLDMPFWVRVAEQELSSLGV